MRANPIHTFFQILGGNISDQLSLGGSVLATPFYARLIIYGSEAWAEISLSTKH